MWASSNQTKYTLRNLQFQTQYNISIRAQAVYCCHSCTALYGEYSNKVSIQTGTCSYPALRSFFLNILAIEFLIAWMFLCTVASSQSPGNGIQPACLESLAIADIPEPITGAYTCGFVNE